MLATFKLLEPFHVNLCSKLFLIELFARLLVKLFAKFFVELFLSKLLLAELFSAVPIAFRF